MRSLAQLTEILLLGKSGKRKQRVESQILKTARQHRQPESRSAVGLKENCLLSFSCIIVEFVFPYFDGCPLSKKNNFRQLAGQFGI